MSPIVCTLLRHAGRSNGCEAIRRAQLTPTPEGRLLDFMLSDTRPAGIVVDAATLTRETARLLTALEDRKLLVRGFVAVLSLEEAVITRAWQAPRALEIAVGCDQVIERIAQLRAGYAANPADYLIHKLHITCPTCLKMLHLLRDNPTAVCLSVEEIARLCSVKRNYLFARAASAGLPPPEAIQALFKLIPAIRELIQGETVEQAARTVHAASPGSLRRSFHIRLDLTTAEIRELSGWPAAVDMWLEQPAVRRRASWIRCHTLP